MHILLLLGAAMYCSLMSVIVFAFLSNDKEIGVFAL